MTRKDYQTQLEDLQENVLYMSEIVREALREGLDVLEAKDPERADAIIEGDHEINELYLELEQDCIDLLALQQPVAGDLRFIASSFKIITDLERIGDLATNLARYSMEASEDRYSDVDVIALGRVAEEMVEDAMIAYKTEDVDLCREIDNRDDELDERCGAASQTVVRDLLKEQVEPESDPDSIDQTLQDVSRLLLTVRDLERVGDHAVNISARTMYMVKGSDELIY